MGIPYGLLFLLSLIFLWLKIKDGGYNTTNINKQLSPAQITPALQAVCVVLHEPKPLRAFYCCYK